MADRITLRNLEAVTLRLNRAVNGSPRTMAEGDMTEAGYRWGSPEDFPTHYRDADGFHQVPETYYIDGAYEGVALYRNSVANAAGESHGVSDVFGCGHMPKRELYYRIQAMLEGIEAVQA